MSELSQTETEIFYPPWHELKNYPTILCGYCWNGFGSKTERVPDHEKCLRIVEENGKTWFCRCICNRPADAAVDESLAALARELGVDLASLSGPAEPDVAIAGPTLPVADPLDIAVGNHTPEPTATPLRAASQPGKPEFQPTKTGRAARGQLEFQVYEVCNTWRDRMDHETRPDCTPNYISQIISRDYEIKLPSVGAIGAVFDRWESRGWCEQAKKPVRFLRFTGRLKEVGLFKAKEEYKRTEKRTASAIRRGERP